MADLGRGEAIVCAGLTGKPQRDLSARWLLLFMFTCLLLISCLILPGQVRAAGLRNLADGWLLPSHFQKQVIGLSRSAESATGASCWLMAGSCRLFGMDQLPVRELSGGLRNLFWNQGIHLSGRWETTGAALFRESWWQGRLGWGGHLGLWFRRWSLFLAGEGAGSADCWGCDGRCNLWEQGDTRIAARVWWNLNTPPGWFGLQGRYRLACLSIVHNGWGLSLDMDRRISGNPGLTLDVLLGIAPSVGVGLRSDPVTGTHGPTLVYGFQSLLLRTSHLAHPDLGITHRFSLVWGDPGPGGP